MGVISLLVSSVQDWSTSLPVLDVVDAEEIDENAEGASKLPQKRSCKVIGM